MRRLSLLFLTLQLALGPLLAPPAAAQSQSPDIDAVLARMTPAERVGQLFLVTFYGTAEPGSDIERLIVDYHVGGVVLLAANDNITDTLAAPAQVQGLSNRLQTLAAGAAPTVTVGSQAAAFVPLWIATAHDGDGYPFSEIRSGLTELPSPMAIGATWDPAQARTVGEIAGQELATLGVNLLLGPALDVLETPRFSDPGGRGTRVLGGDPFWVGSLGAAYIAGVHAGSAGRVGVVAKSFPGYGASDRDPAEEVPTVRKSLDELRQIDLLPFFMVTGQAGAPDAAADGLLTGHIRFQGFQGNIRQTTSPVSFDPRALGELLALPELSSWRAAGGLTLSDSLGSRAVKRFYDPGERDFNPRRIASEAFIAGNDLLFLEDFGLNPRQDQTRNIVDVISYFGERYASDRTFAGQVDSAVKRILQVKLRLTGGRLSLDRALRAPEGLPAVGQGRTRVLELARAAASLISPSLEELAARSPEPPGPSERIVFFTDSQVGQQCSQCPRGTLLDRRSLETAVLNFYGPGGSGQVSSRNLQSFTFEDLSAYLDARANPPPAPGDGTPTPAASPVETALNQADWIVLATLGPLPGAQPPGLVSAFLRQRPDLLRNKQTVVFDFGAPYFLDTTDLSKLTAFYSLYSKAEPFVEVAARLLFRELVPAGRPPVSVEAVNYDLLKVTAPDPRQTIDLLSDTLPAGVDTPAPTDTLTATVGLKVGDVLALRTSTIRDLNGHAVPDGTPVRFMLVYTTGDGGRDFDFIDAQTRAGVARADLTLNRIGFLEISISEPAVQRSAKLQIPVQQGTTFFITPIVPPTETPTATPRASDTPPPPTVTPPPATPAPSGELLPGNLKVRPVDFMVMLAALAAAVGAAYRLGGGSSHPRRAVRLALLAGLGVLAAYNYFALNLPGAAALDGWLGGLAPALVVVLGGAAGLAAGWYWMGRRLRGR